MWVVLIICITIVALKYLDAKYSCKHKWKVIQKGDEEKDYVVQCEVCGEIEKRNL